MFFYSCSTVPWVGHTQWRTPCGRIDQAHFGLRVGQKSHHASTGSWVLAVLVLARLVLACPLLRSVMVSARMPAAFSACAVCCCLRNKVHRASAVQGESPLLTQQRYTVGVPVLQIIQQYDQQRNDAPCKSKQSFGSVLSSACHNKPADLRPL